jgi:hypothetical protein
MKDLSGVSYFEPAEKLVRVLCKKTQSEDPLFFRVLTAYYFTKVASMMRCSVKTPDRGNIPVSLYAINLASSGFGKGHATNIIEEQIINKFQETFLSSTFPLISEDSLAKLSVKRANKKSTDPDEELIKVEKEFNNLGALAFSFDSGTSAAVKQMRHKLLMAEAGSMNFEMDELGSNLLGNTEVLNVFLELFDVGKVKQKLTKNTAENTRSEEINGRTPTNLLLFGTPSKLLNGGKVEEEFYAMLETGYARRCLFGFSKKHHKSKDLTPEQVYDMLTDKSSIQDLLDLSDQLGNLADKVNFNKVTLMSREVSIELISYKMYCEAIAATMPEHEEIQKAELSHRYFKALKLAGTYAFIAGSFEITEEILYNAIKLIEDSGKAFSEILTRDRNYVKLAKYIAEIGRELTHVDLVEDLPFYKGSESQKRELMTLAIAYGYKNNIIIKKHYIEGIEFMKGESLKETNLDEMILSYSTQLAENYEGALAPFDKLHQMTNQPNLHWANHNFIGNYRLEDNVIPGFNIVVIDVDGEVSVETAKLLLQEYKYLIYTTKRHTDNDNRFRIMLPISHKLALDGNEFKGFMANIFDWLPFKVDTATNQRSRKWLTHKGNYWYNEGELLDALLFIPKTSKSDAQKQRVLDLQSLSNLERWFINNTGEGNRSNQLIKYALVLVDSGMGLDSIRNNLLALNNKLPNKLDDAEIVSTILITAAKAISKKALSIAA